jgi:molybdopterin synthase sulfur carrier subunit
MPEVRLFGSLRLRSKMHRTALPGATVREVVAALCEASPDLGDMIWRDGELLPFVRITVNGHDIVLGEGLDTVLAESDSLAVFPPIAGG